MRRFVLVSLIAVAGCGPSAGDARNLEKTFHAAAAIDDRPLQDRILMRGCSEISSCAGGCKKVLEACSDSLVDESQCATLFASCFADYRAARDKPEVISAADWFRGSYLPAYADKARAALGSDDGAVLQLYAARKKAGIP